MLEEVDAKPVKWRKCINLKNSCKSLVIVTSPRRFRCFARRQHGVQQQQMRTRQQMKMTIPVTMPKKLITPPPPMGPNSALEAAQHLRCQEGPQHSVKWSGSPSRGQLKAVSTLSEKMYSLLLIQHLCPALPKTPSMQSKAERSCPQMFWPKAIFTTIRKSSGMISHCNLDTLLLSINTSRNTFIAITICRHLCEIFASLIPTLH